MEHKLYTDLVDQLRNGKVIVMAGTGVSIEATGNSNSRASWKGLIQDGLKRASAIDPSITSDWLARCEEELSSGNLDDMLSVAEKVSKRLGAPDSGEWSRWLRESVGTIIATDKHLPNAIAQLSVPVATTNYDEILDKVIGPGVSWLQPVRIQRVLEGLDRAVAHLHGHWEDPRSVILGIRSYDTIRNDPLTQLLQNTLVVANCLVFIGVNDGLSDPNWAPITNMLKTVMASSERRHYILCLDDALQDMHNRYSPARIFPIAYGSHHSELAPFVEQLAQDAGRSAPKTVTKVGIGIITDGSRVVLARRRKLEGALDWTFPAGFVRRSEGDTAAAWSAVSDEILDETALKVELVQNLGERIHPDADLPCIYFHARVKSGKLKNGQPKENLEVRWVEADDVFRYISEASVFEPVREILRALGTRTI